MKTLIYFFSCLSLLVLVGCQKSPEEMCFDSQMKLWDQTPVDKDGDKFLLSTQGYFKNNEKGKTEWEATAWTKCIKR